MAILIGSPTEPQRFSPMVLSAVKISLVVGTVLTLINQGDILREGMLPPEY